MPNALQWIASWNPISALVAAVRELFGNPTSPLIKDAWPLEHPVAASWIYCAVLRRRLRARGAAPLPPPHDRLIATV